MLSPREGPGVSRTNGRPGPGRGPRAPPWPPRGPQGARGAGASDRAPDWLPPFQQDMENKIRSTLNEIYFGKTKDIVNGLRQRTQEHRLWDPGDGGWGSKVTVNSSTAWGQSPLQNQGRRPH